MFKRTKEYIKSNNVSPEIFIKGYDYANSELLIKLDRFKECEEFIITKNEHRIDLIAREIYGDEKYSWILLYINRCSVKDLKRGDSLNFIPLDQLNSILNSI